MDEKGDSFKMEKISLTTKQLSDYFKEHTIEENDISEITIIHGKTGIGKTDIIKQYLSNIKGYKLYLSDMVKINLYNLNSYEKLIIVFDEILHPFLEEFLKIIDLVKTKRLEVYVISRDEGKVGEFEGVLNRNIANNEYCILEFLELKGDFIASMDYMASPDSYWGNEALTTINCN